MPEQRSTDPAAPNAASNHPTRSDAELARTLMRRQAGLSLRVATVFLALILGVPLLTHFRPDLSQQPIFGFPLSWFILGILFYPITWVLSAYFVKASEQVEAEDAQMIRQERQGL